MDRMPALEALTLAATSLMAFSPPTWAEDHLPMPEDSGTPSQILSSSGSVAKSTKQRKSRTKYRAVRGSSVEDARYMGRDISLDIAFFARRDSDGLGLEITLWNAPEQLEPESLVIYFARIGATAPEWATYLPAPQEDGTVSAWAMYAINVGSGLFDVPIADARIEQQGDTYIVEMERNEDLPRRLVAYVETRSSDDEDWAWTDRAPTRRRGIRMP